MDKKPKQSKRREDVLSSLNVIIEGLNVAQNLSSITPAKAIFGTVGVILTMIRDSMINKEDYVDLGLACSAVCTALDRGLKGKQLSDLNGSVLDAIGQLTTTVADIRSKIAKRSERNAISRAFHAKNDGQTIASWRLDLDRFLLVFNTELGLNIYVAVSDVREGFAKAHTTVTDTHIVVTEVQRDVADTHAMVSDIRRQVLGSQEGADDQGRSNQASIPGESPPPAPRACFGRSDLTKKIVGLAKKSIPVALIGPGGIGKTSIALTVLHHPRIKQRFGPNRRFIRCDQFPALRPHLLSRLSKVIGAGIENPEDLGSLRPFLSARDMVIVLDNAEAILDPGGSGAEEIYAVVEELSQFDNVWLCITSRISAVPSDCETLEIPTLSIEAARDAFYRTYKGVGRSDLVDNILGQLDFHPLSITLLATVAHQNKWDTDRLMREWERQRTRMLQTMHNRSFVATIELSLTSPMFQELGPDARGLLEVVAFFPQGVNESNLGWLLPTVSNGTNILDKFCVLSLTYRNNSFITMLAPLRDHLRPKDPKSSRLLRMAKKQYFTRMSVKINRNGPEYGEARWITSEDVNIEHLLDVFTTINANSDSVWGACANFINHLSWHKSRPTILRSKIEGLPDNRRSKPRCLFALSQLCTSVGNHVECKQFLTHALKLYKEQGADRLVASTLMQLSDTNRLLGLRKEGIRLAKEGLETLEWLGDTAERARCLNILASLLREDKQFNAAEEAASRAIDLLPEKGQEAPVFGSHRHLGLIYQSKGEMAKAIGHFEMALGIASSFNWHDYLSEIHYSLAQLFLGEGRFDDAQNHIERAKLYTSNHPYHLGLAMELQARLWYRQHRMEEARSEVLRAADVHGKLGAVHDLERCRGLLQQIEEEMKKPVIPEARGID